MTPVTFSTDQMGLETRSLRRFEQGMFAFAWVPQKTFIFWDSGLVPKSGFSNDDFFFGAPVEGLPAWI